MSTRISFLMMAFVSLFLLGGCASLGKSSAKKTTEVDVHVMADWDINQDVLGIPSPVRLSFLQLASEIEFRQMMQMNTDDVPYTEFLGKSVLDETNVVIRPDQILDFKLPLNEKTRYLGVVAAYRDEGSAWKTVLSKQESRWYQFDDTNFLYLQVMADNMVQLSEEDASEKILAKTLKAQGEDVTALSEKQKGKLLRQVRKQMKNRQPVDWSKGYFAVRAPTSVAEITFDNVGTLGEPSSPEAPSLPTVIPPIKMPQGITISAN